MSALTAEGVGTVLGAITILAGGVMYARERLSNAKLRDANNEAGVAVAASQESVFNLVTLQLESLKRDMEALRSELTEERRHSRVLQAHIYKLEATMRKHNIDPPIFEAM